MRLRLRGTVTGEWCCSACRMRNRAAISDASGRLSDPLLSGVDTERFLVEGEPPSEIAQGAIDHDVDLITVVMRDRNRLSRAFGSSTAEDIIAESPCAVLAVRPPQRDFVEQGRIRDSTQTRAPGDKLPPVVSRGDSTCDADGEPTRRRASRGLRYRRLFRTDFSDLSRRWTGRADANAEVCAGTNGPSLTRRRAGMATHVTEGRPYQEIVKLADTVQADLIVIGTAVHGSLFGNSQVLGSEIERVIRNAPCPVLCVPAGRVVTPLPALVTQIVPQT